MKEVTVKKVYELKPRWSHPKSFYGKANVIVLSNGVKLLQSYETIVAGINTAGRFCKIWDNWSPTTAKHLEAFCEDYAGKKAWNEMPVDKAFASRYGLFHCDTNYKITWY